MSTLNIQPPRVALTNPKTGEITREWYRYITDSFERQGGKDALTNIDLEMLASNPSANSDSSIGQTIDLLSRVDEGQLSMASMVSPGASIAALQVRVDELQNTIASLSDVLGQISGFVQRINDIEQLSSYQDPYRVDWERPGKIGVLTANTVRGTTIESTVPTGTAPLIVASTTKVSNLNADLLDGGDWASPGTIGGTTPASASFTSVNLSGQLTSNVATGTPPLVIASTTKIPNLNVDLLNGTTWIAPGPIGGTTPAAAVFTALTATGAVTCGTDTTTTNLLVRGANSGTSGGSAVYCRNGAATFIIAIGNKSAIAGGAYDATPYLYSNTSAIEFSAGFKTNGNIGFFGTTPVAKPTITGSRGGNAALASLLTGLAGYGLLTDSSTA